MRRRTFLASLGVGGSWPVYADSSTVGGGILSELDIDVDASFPRTTIKVHAESGWVIGPNRLNPDSMSIAPGNQVVCLGPS